MVGGYIIYLGKVFVSINDLNCNISFYCKVFVSINDLNCNISFYCHLELFTIVSFSVIFINKCQDSDLIYIVLNCYGQCLIGLLICCLGN